MQKIICHTVLVEALPDTAVAAFQSFWWPLFSKVNMAFIPTNPCCCDRKERSFCSLTTQNRNIHFVMGKEVENYDVRMLF
jgi:hypothetical protein